MKAIKLKCRCEEAKTHKYFMDSGIQGEFVLDLCDRCNSNAATCWMLEWHRLKDSKKRCIGP